MADLERLIFARKIAACLAAALAALACLELVAGIGFHESAVERNAFGFDRETAFSLDGPRVNISPAASRRFWAQSYPLNKPEGWKRVVVVGDSAARGGALDDSISDSLRAQLADRCGLHAEVWNLSSPGYGSRRKAIVVDKALDFHPDLIIYHAGLTTEYEDGREWERYREYHSWHPRHWADQLPFVGRVKLSKLEKLYWRWLPDDVRALSTQDPLEVRLAAITSKFDGEYWRPRMLSNLDETVAEAGRARVPMIILVHANFDAASGRLDDSGLDRAIAERYASRSGIAVVSNRSLFAGEPDVAALFYDVSHWTSAGKDAIARALARPAALLAGASPRCSAEPITPAATPPRSSAARVADTNRR
jgi:hypothetical protein